MLQRLRESVDKKVIGIQHIRRVLYPEVRV